MTQALQSGDSLPLYRRLLGYALPYKGMFAIAVVGMVLLSLSAAGFTALMKPLVDNGFVGRDPAIIKWTPLLIVLLFVVRGVANLVAQYATAWVGRRVTYDLRNQLFGHMVRLPSGYYERHPSSTLIAKLIFDVEQVSAGVTSAVFTIVSDGLTLIALFAWIFYLNWKLTILFLIMLPFSTLLLRVMSRRFRTTSHQIQGSMAEITQVTKEAADGQRIVKAFGAEQSEARTFSAANERNRRQTLRRVAISGIGMGLIQIFGALALAGVIYIALHDPTITAGAFTSYIAAATWMMGPSRRLAKVNETVQTALAAAQSAFSVLDTPAEPDTGTVARERVEGRIEYRDVRFRYSEAAPNALDGISLAVDPGQMVALVGASGSGKTTCVSLMPRFYRPDSGTILLDGIDLNDYRLGNLRAHIALVGQEATLFDTSIRHNIAYGVLGEIDEQRLQEAARAAHVLEFAERLPEGLDTPVGERGSRLSGGQRQRVAIARALYRNAPILILDEATSALDTESERFVQDAMNRLMKDRTTLVIAHRLSTVEHADRILVFARGRIVESGTHAELLAANGVYAGLYRNQFREPAH